MTRSGLKTLAVAFLLKVAGWCLFGLGFDQGSGGVGGTIVPALVGTALTTVAYGRARAVAAI